MKHSGGIMETPQQLLARIRHKLQTEPYPISLTKMEWAQILGICDEAADKTTNEDIRWEAVRKLEAKLLCNNPESK